MIDIDRALLSDARHVLREIQDTYTKPSDDYLVNWANHIVHALENPSKAKLKSVVKKILVLSNRLDQRSNLRKILGSIQSQVERVLNPPKPEPYYHNRYW